MIETTRIYIRLVVKYVPGKLRKDYEAFTSEILSKKGYSIEDFQTFSDRIELSLSSLTKSPSSIERELAEIGSHIENGLSLERVANVVSILFLTADPTDASRLRLGEEFREIQQKLQLSKLREQFKLHQRTSVRPADISQALLDVQPQIMHFSGHGTATGALCFENQVGQTHPIQPDALAALFEQFANQVNCVVLNACYAESQAHAIAKHIDYVIGMNRAISDMAAIAFAVGFYQALGAGRTIEDAYKLGCVQIRLQGIPEHLTPVLIKNGQAQTLPPPNIGSS